MQLSDAEAIRKCVVFDGYRKAGKAQVRGTAFFIGHRGFRYLVTAKHNILNAQKAASSLLIRFNNRSGGVSELETDFKDWTPHPDAFADVSILQISDQST